MGDKLQKLRDKINKKAGYNVAFDLNNSEPPSKVTEWISTGSRLLDSIIANKIYGNKPLGIPVGRISEIAGMEGTGKTFLALQIAKNAINMGLTVIYFDSESTTENEFLKKIGCNLDNLIYLLAPSMEFVLETIEDLLGEKEEGQKFLFILDSLAAIPCESDIESNFNPLSDIAAKPRVITKGLQKLTIPLAVSRSTLLILNQLRDNISAVNKWEKLSDPYRTPGGKAAAFSYSLRLWITLRKGKDSFIYDKLGNRIGSEVNVVTKKSKFGTFGRNCEFQIVWGGDGNAYVLDRESWLEPLKKSDNLISGGPWFTLKYIDGTEEKFQSIKWLEKLKEEKFYDRVIELLDEILIR